VFEGPVWVSQTRCHKKGDVSMEPGDLEILGISSDEILTRELVTASFKRLAKETHPDRPNGDKEQFQKLQMAFMRALKTIEVERQGSLCMACYVREMDLWRDRKEEGDPGLRPRYCGSTPCSQCGTFKPKGNPGQRSPERTRGFHEDRGVNPKNNDLFWPL